MKVAARLLFLAPAARGFRPSDGDVASDAAGRPQQSFLEVSASSSLALMMSSYGTATTKCELPDGLALRPTSERTPEKMLADKKPFTYMRWGDGEWMAAAGNQEYVDVLKSYPSVSANNYYPILGTFFLCKDNHPALFHSVDNLLKENQLQLPFYDRFYIDPLLIVRSAWSRAGAYKGSQPWTLDDQPGRAGPVVTCADVAKRAPEKSDIILVGPSHLNQLTKLFRHRDWIDGSDADSRTQEIADKMVKASEASERPLFFLVATGWAKLLITHKIYDRIGSKDTIIDIGSSFDPYANVMSRDYSPEARKRICRDTPCFTTPGTCDGIGS